MKKDAPGEVQQPEPVDMLLILRRHCDTMDRALDISGGQERQGVACVDSECSVLRLGPLPLVGFVVTDLECCHRLSESLSVDVNAKRYEGRYYLKSNVKLPRSDSRIENWNISWSSE